MRTGKRGVLTVAAALLLLCASGAAAKNVHDGSGPQGSVGCLDCHRRLPLSGTPSFTDEAASCAGCHRAVGHTHPVQVIPSMAVPADLPLDDRGRVVCYTCHTYHTGQTDSEGKKAHFLRRQHGRTLCYSCHKKLYEGGK